MLQIESLNVLDKFSLMGTVSSGRTAENLDKQPKNLHCRLP